MSHTVAPFVVSRVFKAPRKLMWDLYSLPEHQLPVLGPAGDPGLYSNMDFRVGGTHHYAMSGGGAQMWGLQRYLEIVPMEKIVLVQAFSDQDRGITRHPMAPTWPVEMHSTLQLEDTPDGQCKVTVTWVPHTRDPDSDATFDAARQNMEGGFGHLFGVIDQYLTTLV